MERYAAAINTYKVGFARTKDSRGIVDFERTHLPYNTYLHLKVSGIGNNGITDVHLYFVESKFIFPDDDYRNRRELGLVDNRKITLYLEQKDFEHSYKIIQSERPLKILWEQLDNRRGTIISAWTISTHYNERPGEGDSEL